MSAKIYYAVAALCILQSATALVRRDAAAGEGENTLEGIQKQATELVGQWFNQIGAAVNNEEWKKNLQNNTDVIVKTLQEWTKEYSSQVDLNTVGDNVKQSVTDAVQKMNQTIEELRAKHPEIETKAKEVSQTIQSGLQNVFTETDKVVKSLAQNTEGVRGDLEKATKEGYTKLVQTLQDLSAKANDAANKA